MAKRSHRGMTKRFLISEMDQSVKRMLKLIQEEGDSFAKKAEIYYQKRPILVSQVEEFYRMFRQLAERYENATNSTVEVRKSMPSDIPGIPNSHSSISDTRSEPPSKMPSPDHRLTRRLSGPRPNVFDVMGMKEGYETSTFGSDSDSDDSSVFNYSSASTYGNYRQLRKRIVELEGELKRVQNQQGVVKNDHTETANYDEELRVAKEKIRSSEMEIEKLKIKVQKYESIPSGHDHDHGHDHCDRINELERKLASAEEEVKRLYRGFKSEWDQISRYKVRLFERDEEVLRLQERVKKLLKERDMVKELEVCDDEMGERDELIAKMGEEMSFKDEMMEHLNQRLEKVEKKYEKCRRVKEEMEKVIKKQEMVIEEGVKEKEEAVRQLCVSVEHYRNAYQMLRKDLLEQKKPVTVSW